MNKETIRNIIADKKKVISILLAVVIVVIAVVGVVTAVRNKKEIYIDSAGVEHWLYKDKEGNTVVNSNGMVVVYATDFDGKRQKDENGDYKTAAIDFPEIVVEGNLLQTPYYKLTMPKKWELLENGEFVYKKNENITLNVNKLGAVGDKTLKGFVDTRLELYEDLMNDKKAEYPASKMLIGNTLLTSKAIECMTVEYKMMKEENGAVEYYVQEIYYIQNGYVFQIVYSCENGSYDETINMLEILGSNFATKDAGNK